MEDEKIIELSLSRDTELIPWMAQVYGMRLRQLAYGIVRNDRDAEECEKEAYLQAWNSITSKEPKTHFYGFLAKITRNLALNKDNGQTAVKRNEQIVPLSAELEGCLSAADSAEGEMTQEALCHHISIFLKLQTAERRNLFLRRYWYLDSVAELSERFAMSESKVKRTLFRVRKELKKEIFSGGYGI